jgi:Acetyltransferase (GNAT) family.
MGTPDRADGSIAVLRVEVLSREGAGAYSALLLERHEWLAAHGLDMWDPRNLSIEGMIARYGDPAFFGLFEDETCVGGFLLVERDMRYWPDREGDAAFYFHKFVVGPRFGGRGYADRALEWVKRYGRERGADFVRLDYEKRREYLRRMYLRQGFEDAREIETEDGEVIVLGEHRVERAR